VIVHQISMHRSAWLGCGVDAIPLGLHRVSPL
jgi:hypothetical protein